MEGMKSDARKKKDDLPPDPVDEARDKVEEEMGKTDINPRIHLALSVETKRMVNLLSSYTGYDKQVIVDKALQESFKNGLLAPIVDDMREDMLGMRKPED